MKTSLRIKLRLLCGLCSAVILLVCVQLAISHPQPPLPDTDEDGLTDAQEVELGTNPNNPDTDGDGLIDGVEVGLGTDPLNSNSVEGEGGAGANLQVFTPLK